MKNTATNTVNPTRFQNVRFRNYQTKFSISYHSEGTRTTRIFKINGVHKKGKANAASVSSQLNRAIATLTSIQTRLTALETTGNNQAGGGGGAPRNSNANNTSYCHSHGCTRRNDHVSGTCRNPAEGHIATATLHNR